MPKIPLEKINKVDVPIDIEDIKLQPSGAKSRISSEAREPEYITNPAMIAAAMKPSQWDDQYEDESVLSEMATERLKQFTDEYENLMKIENEDDRIIIKDQLFLVYGKIIRK